MTEQDFPKHEASLHIDHNQHKAYYEKIEDYIRDIEQNRRVTDEDWATPTSKERCLKNDTIWELQWYPNTPVGFNIVYGATLEECIKKANED